MPTRAIEKPKQTQARFQQPFIKKTKNLISLFFSYGIELEAIMFHPFIYGVCTAQKQVLSYLCLLPIELRCQYWKGLRLQKKIHWPEFGLSVEKLYKGGKNQKLLNSSLGNN